MTRKIAIAAVAFLALALAGVTAFVSWRAGYIAFGTVPHADKGEVKAAISTEPPRDGVSSVRKLFRYQDRVAKGDRDAIASQNEIINSIAREYKAFTRGDWSDNKNVQAMMAYVLSGGKTEVVEHFLDTEIASKQQEELAKGVLSFALRRPKTAIKQIGDLDTRTLERPLVGVIALALASLHAAENAGRSVALFDEARLHAPNTAVEEAAIRREVPMLLKAGDTSRASILMSRYVRVFGQSPFAPRFYIEIADDLMTIDEVHAQSAVSALDLSLANVAAHQKSALFLRIARSALVAGKVEIAKVAADIVTAMSAELSPEREKAKLYAAAAIAATEKAESILSDLQSVHDEDFDDDEKSIRSAAEMIARAVMEAGAVTPPPDVVQQNSTSGPNILGASTTDGVSDVVRQADVALKEADRLISSVKQ